MPTSLLSVMQSKYGLVVCGSVYRLVDIVAKLGESRKEGAGYIVWQEVFDNDVKVRFV